MIRSLISAVGLLVLFTGCSGENPKKSPSLMGRVTFQGQSIPGGEIRLRAKNTESAVQEATASIRPDGTFLIADAPTGAVEVLINTEMVRMLEQTAKANPNASLTPMKYVPIPKKYWDYNTSGLGFVIQPGEQSHNFDLTP